MKFTTMSSMALAASFSSAVVSDRKLRGQGDDPNENHFQRDQKITAVLPQGLVEHADRNLQELGDLAYEPYGNGRNTTAPSEGTVPEDVSIGTAAPKLKKTFDGLDFDDNSRLNGDTFSPPDPCGAAGHSRLISVTNCMIEARTKGGKMLWESSLKDFFTTLNPVAYTFDPKIIYDQYRSRFVVVDLDVRYSEPYSSRIFLAVSKDANPDSNDSTSWDYYEIDSLSTAIFGFVEYQVWADYPGFEVDEEAIYITNNMFSFSPRYFVGPKLWIINKNALYDSQSLIVSTLPASEFAALYTSFMPSKVYGEGGIPLPIDHQGESLSSIGTFLVGYNGLSDGVNEYLQVITLYDVLASPPTTPPYKQFVNLGDIEQNSFIELPDAKQAGGTAAIEVNDRRVLDAVWRDGSLWVTFEIRDISIEQEWITKGYYVQLNTTSKDLSVISQGTISGRNIDPLDMDGDEVSTFYPAVDVNRDGFAMFSFSASSPNMFASAFISGTSASSVQCIKEGEGYHLRGARNRWGDYLGISVDPSNEKFFWSYSQYAQAPDASLVAGGRWGTVWARTSGTQGSESKPEEKEIFG